MRCSAFSARSIWPSMSAICRSLASKVAVEVPAGGGQGVAVPGDAAVRQHEADGAAGVGRDFGFGRHGIPQRPAEGGLMSDGTALLESGGQRAYDCHDRWRGRKAVMPPAPRLRG